MVILLALILFAILWPYETGCVLGALVLLAVVGFVVAVLAALAFILT